MRYEELPGPLEGWTYDENGTVYTASGYKCGARTLECALWLFQCYCTDARRHLIHSDEAPGALRPLYELSDQSDQATPTRLRAALEGTGVIQRSSGLRRARKKFRSSAPAALSPMPP